MEHCGVHGSGWEHLDGLPPQAVAFVTRARLLDAAVREVAERGYAAASVAGIAERAGEERRVFDGCFSGKADALIQAYDLAAAFVVPRILEAFRRQEDWAGGARAALATYLAILDADHAWTWTCLRELKAAGPTVADAVEVIRNPVLEALQRSAPVPAAVHVFPLANAVDAVVLDAIEDGSDGLRDRRAELVHALLAPVLGPPRPGAVRSDAVASVSLRAAGPPPTRFVDRLDDPSAQVMLGALVREAAAHRDGPALWRIVELLAARRQAGGSVPDAVEADALNGLERAWAFGLTPLHVS